MLPEGVLPALLPIVRILEALGVAYHVGGSVASSLWSIPRTTQDVDVVANLQLSHVAPLVAALEADYYIDAETVSEAVRRRASFNVIHLDTMFKVDIFVQPHRPFEQSALLRARTAPAEAVGRESFRLTSPEDIVLHKLIWYRMGGEVSERQWRDILTVLQVQGPNLDREYMQEWASQLQVADLLAEAWVAVEPLT